VVHRDVAEQVVERVVQASASWAPADPLLPGTSMGPLVDQRSLSRILSQLDEGVGQGAQIRTGGNPARPESGGPYLEPTVVTGAGSENVLVRQELFGPVLAVQTFGDEDEALRIASDTEFGLAAAVWTSDLGRAHRMSRRLRAGTVWVNCYEEGDMTVPFGGVKLSGAGRDKSRHAIEEYTDLKTTWMAYG
jgi:gamma-glutamyl-gamma-aminobutyraldehyde dehydrogenase